MLCAFGRDELAAQFWTRKLFLLDEEHVEPSAREMYRRTTPRRPRPRDNYVKRVHILLIFLILKILLTGLTRFRRITRR